MSNVVIQSVSEQDLRSKSYADIAGRDCFEHKSSKLQTAFKRRASLVRSMQAELANYPAQDFVAYVGELNGKWYGFYTES